jgi:hypothetical protein
MSQFIGTEMNESVQSQQPDQRFLEILANITDNANKLKETPANSNFAIQELKMLHE